MDRHQNIGDKPYTHNKLIEPPQQLPYDRSRIRINISPRWTTTKKKEEKKNNSRFNGGLWPQTQQQQQTALYSWQNSDPSYRFVKGDFEYLLAAPFFHL